jgi:hypothetical protein
MSEWCHPVQSDHDPDGYPVGTFLPNLGSEQPSAIITISMVFLIVPSYLIYVRDISYIPEFHLLNFSSVH